VERDGDGRGVRGGTRAGSQPLTATPRQKRLTLVACILSSAIVFVDGTVVNVALPAISDDLDAGLATQQWVIESYLLMLGSLILIGGSLSDLFGRRRVFALGVGGFGATSVLCAVAPSAELLIAARALQGVAGALLVPSALAVIVSTFEPSERGAAIGSWTAWSGVSTLIGPFLGGVLVDAVSWRLVFAIGLLPIAATLYLIARHVPRAIDHRLDRHVDVPGAVLCAVGLSGVVFALIEQPSYGWSDPLVGLPLVVGAICLALFLLQERRSPDPMLPLGLFRRRNFAAGNAATFLIYGGLGGAFFFMPIFLQGVAGFSAAKAGLALVPMTIVMFLLAKRFGALADRIGARPLMSLGPLVATAGILLLLRLDEDTSSLTDVVPAVLAFGLGMSMVVAPLTASVLADADGEHAGIASGVNNAISRVAGLVAIAAVGALVASWFGSALDERLDAASGVSPAARAAAADAKARPLDPQPPPPGLPATQRELIESAVGDASVEAFRFAASASALLMLLGGVVSAAGMTRPRREVPCAECPGGALVGAPEDVARVAEAPRRLPEPAGAPG
jgi:EmrB/QacA subfamily drug resistance transporter